ncbi:hypothetical protein F2Q68_00002143 [Brassica cretica]|uniref:Uncharacterized protein n=1 Tax=Brassica cretica TaxID=69181 RepID=A0A8S9JED2_BRACR|nr:hypothetical protein F2Q68_00002143 [Brassica cretica]
MHTSTTSHLAVPEHPRPPICTEEVDGFHKRVKRIHDHVKFVVPCIVFEVESPIPANRSVHLAPTETTSIDTTTSSSIDIGRVSEQKEFEVC